MLFCSQNDIHMLCAMKMMETCSSRRCQYDSS